MTKLELIDLYEGGDIDKDEFVAKAHEIGIEIQLIERILQSNDDL